MSRIVPGPRRFRLSLFGYDFAADHQALAGGERPRANVKQPLESLILQKPTLEVDHEGGERIKLGAWQHRVLLRWIESGTSGVKSGDSEFARLEIQPSQIEFLKAGDTSRLRVLAHWVDGSCEDVTPLSRFRSNDETIADVDETGQVIAVGPGDTHLVAFYDNGVAPVPVLLPVSDQVNGRYPEVPTPTKIDELVSSKLRRLGVVPSELCGDGEFLRRASLDVTGVLPTPVEAIEFAADSSSDKRVRKIDELLARPTYVAWWTTRLCDITGANPLVLNEAPFDGARAAAEWYRWIYQRVEQNVPYDEIAAGLILATSRPAGQSYDEYCQQMTQLVTAKDAVGAQSSGTALASSATGSESRASSFESRATMPHYWLRRNNRKPEDMAQGFAYSFMGVRLQCAQCHKHPFDQWTKQDFDEFSGFFRRVSFGFAPDARKRSQEIREALSPKGEKKVDLKKELPQLVAAGKMIPWPEVFIAPRGKDKAKQGGGKKKAKGKDSRPAASDVIAGKILNGQRIDLAKYDDPREALLQWLRADAERYFARSLVNRVWAVYFSVGIVEPADDLNLANPPSNEPLLVWLTKEFIAHDYDLKWLHREIVGSRAYQLSCEPNETNRFDTRNFSRGAPRRLPAEVAYNAILQATARTDDLSALQMDPSRLVTGCPEPGNKTLAQRASYALGVFGKPARATNCDCERTQEPSLLQTLYLRNDQDMLSTIDRPDGWMRQLAADEKQQRATLKLAEIAAQWESKQQQLSLLLGRLDELQQARQSDAARRLRKQVQSLQGVLKNLAKQQAKLSSDIQPGHINAVSPPPSAGELARQAFLRTLSRPPTEAELKRSEQHLAEAESLHAGTRDLLWALLNTKEFILNH